MSELINCGFRTAFAWLKCEREEDSDCYEVLRQFNITGRAGSLFGVESRFVRLSLVRRDDDFDLLLRQINKMVSEESDDKIHKVVPSSASTLTVLRENRTRKSNESEIMMMRDTVEEVASTSLINFSIIIVVLLLSLTISNKMLYRIIY